MKKEIISFLKPRIAMLLAVAMIISMLPLSVFAADITAPETTWESVVTDSFTEAASSLESYTHYSVVDGVAVEETVTIDTTATLGSKTNPIAISSPEDLIRFGKQSKYEGYVSSGPTDGKYYILTEEVYDMGAHTMLPLAPVAVDYYGYSSRMGFGGTLIGNGATISNAYVVGGTATIYAVDFNLQPALFGALNGGKIWDLTVKDCTVSEGVGSMGLLYAQGQNLTEDAIVNVTVTGGNMIPGEYITNLVLLGETAVSGTAKATLAEDYTLQSDLTLYDGETLTIPEGVTLTVPEDKALTVKSGAELVNNGAIVGGATVEEGGTISGSGDMHTHSGGTATCGALAVCGICGQSYGELLDKHTFVDGVCTVCNAKQEIVIEMTDSYGDGWSDNAIEIYAGEKLVGTATIEDGDSGTWSMALDVHATYTFKWYEGSFSSETGFIIYVETKEKANASGFDYSTGDTIVTVDAACAEPAYENGVCTACGTACVHTSFTDSVCTVCGLTCGTDTTHSWDRGVCTRCEKNCGHEAITEGVCDICSGECGDVFAHSINSEFVCIVCGFVCPEHSFESGTCTICGYACPHQWDSNGFCTNCDDYQPAEDADEDGLYEIANAGNLYWFARQVNTGNGAMNAELTADIVINKNVLNADGSLNGDGSGMRQWVPIGVKDFFASIYQPYTGTFEGNDHTISGLYYSGDGDSVGLFGYVNGGNIYNTGIVDSYYWVNSYSDVGGVVGVVLEAGQVSGCYNTGTVCGGEALGGVVGTAEKSQIHNCYNTGKLESNSYTYRVGGVVAYTYATTVSACYNTADIVVSGSDVGGVVGEVNGNIANKGEVKYCYNTGNISNDRGHSYTGGVCGTTFCQILSCYNTGTVSGSGDVGGVVGYFPSTSYSVSYCYYNSDVFTGTAVGVTMGAVNNSHGLTMEQFRSGEACWRLNKSASYGTWKQTIGTDALPGFEGDTVYQVSGTYCTGEAATVYSNTDADAGTVHKADENGDHLCDTCGEVATDCKDWDMDHNCDTCDKAISEHTGGNATCEAGAVCDICGQTYTDVDHSNHAGVSSNGVYTCCNWLDEALRNEQGYYEISTAQQLLAFATMVNNATEFTNMRVQLNAMLMADIDMTGLVWSPMGYIVEKDNQLLSEGYGGTFDGNGHTVSGISCTVSCDDANAYAGFFGRTYNATVKNLLVQGSFEAEYNGNQYSAYVGGIAGYGDTTTIENCGFVGSVSGKADMMVVAGGLVGNFYRSTVSNSYANATVTGIGGGFVYVGGLVGSDTDSSTYTNCYYNSELCDKGAVNGEAVEGVTGVTTEQFASGEVCYQLNAAMTDTDDIWFQTIGEDASPVLSGDTVYQTTDCQHETLYSNSEEYGQHIGDVKVVYEWEPYEDGTCYVEVTLYCAACEGYIDSTGGDAEIVETVEGVDCANPGSATYTYTATFDDTVYTETYTHVIPNDNHVGEFANGFCSACDGYEMPVVGENEWGEEIYQIYNAGQLYWFADYINNVNNAVPAQLMADIDLNPGYTFNADGTYTGGNSPRVWETIGYGYSRPYCGHFDGNMHTISGVYCVQETGYVGLFGYTDYNYTIQNVGLSNSYFEGTQSAGALIGCAYTTVQNCFADATVTVVSDAYDVGGLVGYNGGEIINSFAFAGSVMGGGYGSCTGCYYLSEAETEDGGKTAEQFASGEVAYLLQSGIVGEDIYDEETGEWIGTAEAPLVWGQDIGVETTPVLGGKKVYYGYKYCDVQGYTNAPKDAAEDHDYVGGECVNCGKVCDHTGAANGVCGTCGMTVYTVTVDPDLQNGMPLVSGFFATPGRDYTGVIERDNYYMVGTSGFTMKVYIGGELTTNYSIVNGVLTIPGEYVTGDIYITGDGVMEKVNMEDDYEYTCFHVFAGSLTPYEITWAEDYSNATVVVPCAFCEETTTHTLTPTVSTVDPTCTEEGLNTYTVTLRDMVATKDETISATGHASYATDGYCDLCGEFVAPVSATMDGVETFYLTLKEALWAVWGCTEENAVVVKLYNTVDLGSEYLAITSGVFTLDLNGNKLTGSSNVAVLYINGCNMTIVDTASGGTIIGTSDVASPVQLSSGTLNVESGTIGSINAYGGIMNIHGNAVVDGGDSEAVYVDSNGLVNIYGDAQICGDYAVWTSDGTVNIYGDAQLSVDLMGVRTNGGTVNIYGNAKVQGGSYGVWSQGGVVNISDSATFSESAYGIRADGGEVYVNGGEICGTSLDISYVTGTVVLNNSAYFPDGITVSGITLNALLGKNVSYWAGNTMLSVDDEAIDITDKGDILVKRTCTHPYEPSFRDNGDGTHTIYCGICNTVHFTNASHDEMTLPGYEATCTESGLTDGVYCVYCSAIIVKQEEIPVTGHNYVDGYCTGCGIGQPFKITFVDENGKPISEQEVTFGEMPEIPADPTKPQEGCTAYVFEGWDSEIVPVDGEKTYTAIYTETEAHDWLPANCVTPETCNRCGKIDNPDVLGDHEAGDPVENILRVPTCMGDGEKEVFTCCVHCSEELSKEIVSIPSDGKHVYENDVCVGCGEEWAYKTVYFQNNWLWSDVMVYYFGQAEDEPDILWRGVAMTWAANDGTYDIYSARIPASATSVIFSGIKNNGTGGIDQSPDISDVQTDVCYYMKWDGVNTYGSFPYDPEPKVTLKYPTLAFYDEIYYNIYYSLENADVLMANMGLLIFDSALADGTIDDAIENIEGVYREDNGYMVSSYGIPAKKMGDTIYFKAYAKLADGSYIYSELKSYSAVEYANDRLANSDNAKTKALCVALLNYGAAAQTYFGYNTDNLMNAHLTQEQQALVEAYRSDMVAPVGTVDSAKVGDFVANGGFGVKYPSVNFDGYFSIYYNFQVTEPVDGDVTLYYWTRSTYENVDVLTVDNAHNGYPMEEANGGFYRNSVGSIAAKELDDTIYVAAVYESGGVTYCTGVLAYSLGAYCVDRAENGSENMQALAAATAVYGYYAKQYFAAT